MLGTVGRFQHLCLRAADRLVVVQNDPVQRSSTGTRWPQSGDDEQERFGRDIPDYPGAPAVLPGPIRADQLNLMKSSAILINTARGGIVNEADLIQALQNKQIGGAGFDVLTTEPPPADHPMLLYQSPRLIITPHVAWAAKQSRQRLINEIGHNIAAFNQGKVRNSVISQV